MVRQHVSLIPPTAIAGYHLRRREPSVLHQLHHLGVLPDHIGELRNGFSRWLAEFLRDLALRGGCDVGSKSLF